LCCGFVRVCTKRTLFKPSVFERDPSFRMNVALGAKPQSMLTLGIADSQKRLTQDGMIARFVFYGPDSIDPNAGSLGDALTHRHQATRSRLKSQANASMRAMDASLAEDCAYCDNAKTQI
jgi:hypothetical protein